jgi:hypothetical protein
MSVLPSLGSSGAWTLKTPFDALIVSNLAYTCQEVRRITTMVGQGVDVFTQHYARHGLTKAEYDQDVQNDVSMITLITSSGDWLFVPSSYVTGWPAADGVPYATIAAAIVLGALPNTVDPSFLTEDLKAFIKARLGLVPDISYVVVSETVMKDQNQHEILEIARENAKEVDKTLFSQLQDAEATIASQKQTIDNLTAYIKANP